MESDDVPPGLRELEERVRQAKQRTGQVSWEAPAGPSADEKNKGMLSLAFRLGTEILAALIIGAGGGVLIDDWLGTKPWFLVIGFFIGMGGGVVNVYRAVGGLGYAPGYPGRKPADHRPTKHREDSGAPPPAGPEDQGRGTSG